MSAVDICFDSDGFAKFPSDISMEEAKKILKPPGILSNNYNKQGLKKVKRDFIPAKEVPSEINPQIMRQTDHREPIEKPKDLSYFDVKTKRSSEQLYDRIKSVSEGYDQKLHRDDRQHAKQYGLRIHKEEGERRVPATSNALYGHPLRVKLENNAKQHSRREVCKEHFYGRTGGCYSTGEE